MLEIKTLEETLTYKDWLMSQFGVEGTIEEVYE